MAEEAVTLIGLGFAQSPLPQAIFDIQLRLVRTNEAMERAFADGEDGAPAGHTPQSNLGSVMGPGDAETRRAMCLALATGQGQEVVRLIHRRGSSAGQMWQVSVVPLTDSGHRVRGLGITSRELTEHYWSRRRLNMIKDASARIGRSLDVMATARELTEVAVPQFADFSCVELLTYLDRGDEPSVLPAHGPITLRRAAQRSALPGMREVKVAVGDASTYSEIAPPARCLAEGRALIYDLTGSAVDEWSAHDPGRAARMQAVGAHSMLIVPLSARGVTLGVAVFTRHRRPDPFIPDDLLLAEEITARAAVCVDNARRFAKERAAAVTLQRSLLPHRLPAPSALDVASRYLPAAAGADVGGDWFDVIPLSSARVALVVGGVVGHGLRAAANMGELRAVVRALADLELPPEELLTHLDDIVANLSGQAAHPEDGSHSESEGSFGATCLYLVYDPVSRRCDMASAGHPAPALVDPDGTVELLDLPSGPSLGLGTLPFEARSRELAEGSLLCLYSSGLVTGNGRTAEQGVENLQTALARPVVSPDTLCDRILTALPSEPGSGDDDVALLVARTRVLDPMQVASWEVPSDPAAVAEARRAASAQLTAWGFGDEVFTIELVVSELVTNAIRYGGSPIQLRLILDEGLICEVTDGSQTAPHLRRAHVFDEGGRGLMMVAQLVRRWGTRQTSTGKTIWTEQQGLSTARPHALAQ